MNFIEAITFPGCSSSGQSGVLIQDGQIPNDDLGIVQ